MSRLTAAAAALVTLMPGVAYGQALGHQDERPPLVVDLSLNERLDVAIQMFLAELLSAIQRADTVALASLVSDDVVPSDEKRVAYRAGCSLGRATSALRKKLGTVSQMDSLPLAVVRLSWPIVSIVALGDTVARVTARIQERRGRVVRFAPIEFTFRDAGGRWDLALARGILVGMCGLSRPD